MGQINTPRRQRSICFGAEQAVDIVATAFVCSDVEQAVDTVATVFTSVTRP
jgi:hypothetical protein